MTIIAVKKTGYPVIIAMYNQSLMPNHLGNWYDEDSGEESRVEQRND